MGRRRITWALLSTLGGGLYGHWRHGQEVLSPRQPTTHRPTGGVHAAHLALIVIGGTVVVVACLCSFLFARKPARRFIDHVTTRSTLIGYSNRGYHREDAEETLTEDSRRLVTGNRHTDYEMNHL